MHSLNKSIFIKAAVLHILCFAMSFPVFISRAQSGYNYYEWGLGGGASYERGYTNITKQYDHEAFNANFIYNYNPFVPLEAEFQLGQLSGGGLLPSMDPFGREYDNHYKALILHGDVQLGDLINYEYSLILSLLKNIYSGAGGGLVFNSNTVQRYSIYQPSYRFPGSNRSTNIDLALRCGYDFKIYDDYNQPAYAIDIGYIHSVVFDSGLDGYNDPRDKFKHNAEDQYRQVTLTFKYYFGHVTSYTKLIRQFN